jgi:replication-associated recombination protein RarA
MELRLFGPPGMGKTTRLAQRVEGEKEKSEKREVTK